MSGRPYYVALLWLRPIRPGGQPSYHDRYVEGPQVGSHRLEGAIEAIARIQGRTPGEVIERLQAFVTEHFGRHEIKVG
ncbi:hypothetical protein WMF38_33970 [Sorangium sp. So ce118]